MRFSSGTGFSLWLEFLHLHHTIDLGEAFFVIPTPFGSAQGRLRGILLPLSGGINAKRFAWDDGAE